MAQIRFSKHALKSYRSATIRMSLQELADCSGLSARSLARREDPTEPNLIEAEELAKLAHCLGIAQHKLWEGIDPLVDFYGCRIHTAAQLCEIVFNEIKLTGFDVEHIPIDDLVQAHLLEMAKSIESCISHQEISTDFGAEKSSPKPQSLTEKIQAQIDLSNNYSMLTTLIDEPFDFYVIQTSRWNIGNFTEFMDGAYFVGGGWKVENRLVATKADAETPFKRVKTYIAGTWITGEVIDKLPDQEGGIDDWLHQGRHDMISVLTPNEDDKSDEVPF